MMHALLESLGGNAATLTGAMFDMLIIVAVGGLWLMWARSLKRQKNVEDILAATSTQLEEASRNLQSALQEIQRLQERQKADDMTGTAAGVARPASAGYTARAYRQAQQIDPPDDDIPDTLQPAAQPPADPSSNDKPQPAATQPVSRPSAPRPARPAPSARDTERPEPVSPASPASDEVERILRLHRLGTPAEQIATQLNLPLARINLLLRLHEQRSAGAAAG